MTGPEALAACLALGTPRDVCEEKVRSQSVAGAYCDGTIVLEVGKPPRCVPRAVADAKRAQARIPTSAPAETSTAGVGAGTVLGVVALGAVLAGGIYLLTR